MTAFDFLSVHVADSSDSTAETIKTITNGLCANAKEAFLNAKEVVFWRARRSAIRILCSDSVAGGPGFSDRSLFKQLKNLTEKNRSFIYSIQRSHSIGSREAPEKSERPADIQ